MNSWLMIEVQDLVKRYAGHTALKGISFNVARGQVVGLLGSNGAGKSTTMRILSGFMPATSGVVRVSAEGEISGRRLMVSRRFGLTDLIILTGYRGRMIEDRQQVGHVGSHA